ncbi:DUF3135 domain-containing protein [Pseudomaricurvus sp.]|uniref:DUF3135 domain-containing protein n=1 Tax=Pseudomaricurvus sp. TaxID=2004510 RepID=UPI003F6B6D2E
MAEHSQSSTPHLSFDELAELAQSDPQAFEAYRSQQIDNVINEAPEYLRHRLRGLQFQVDAQRSLHDSPLGSCIKISQMMHDSFAQLQTALNSASDLTNGSVDTQSATEQTNQAEHAPHSAKVLHFPAHP